MKALQNNEDNLKQNMADVISRVEALEATTLTLEYNITKLTPSDDLEIVKGKINEIIDLLSRD